MSEHTGFHNKEHYSPDCSQCEQDKLLLKEIRGVLATSETMDKEAPFRCLPEDCIDWQKLKAQRILAKVKQHYEQNKVPAGILEATIQIRIAQAKELLAKVKTLEQKGLDRPELREEVEDILIKVATEPLATKPNGIQDELGQILALIPDIEELEETITYLEEAIQVMPECLEAEADRVFYHRNAGIDVDLEDLEEAKKQERERIATIASFTVKLEGNTVVVDKYDWDRLWQALKGE